LHQISQPPRFRAGARQTTLNTVLSGGPHGSHPDRRRFSVAIDGHPPHEALTAEDGAAGVEVAKREIPDLILMDVVMPNLNGFQATRTICREPSTKHIPIVLVTTKDQDTDRMWGMRQGAKAYLTKPFSETELSDTITKYVAGLG
jgi:twitching motility two-component system response regulator PilH